MNISDRGWMLLALLGAVLGIGLLLLSGVGYSLGWNDTGGVRYHSNVVPLSLFAGLAFLCLGGAVLLARSPQAFPRCPASLGIVLLALVAWLFVVPYVKNVSALIAVRADIVMGSESQFVDHIIRYRVGQPQYTPAEDANTSAYAPAAPLLTYFIASALGYATSIPAFRLVQQLYLLLAVFFAAAAARELFRFFRPESRLAKHWLFFWVPFLYLIANNPDTNVYTHVLYSDALALTVNAFAFWLMVKHFITEDDRWLIPMAVLPALGFLAKQKEIVWVGLYLVYLVLAGRVAWRRIVPFGAVAFSLAGLAIGLCYALWGPPFYFWAFEVLSGLHVSLREVLEQIAESGWYMLMGLLGGILVLRGEGFRRLFPLWITWLLQVLIAAYSSGIAFRPAHLGPATLIGAVWFLVGLGRIWPEEEGSQEVADRAGLWWRTVTMPTAVFLFLLGAGILRLGPAVPSGMEGYIKAIEKEFDGLPRDRVLLDTGSWVYLPENVVMRDRESPIGTLWGTGTSDFAATTERIRNHYYQKILVRKFEDGEFLYRDERIRQALRESYQEIHVIPSPGVPSTWLYYPLLYDVSVLTPANSSAALERGGTSTVE